MTNPELDLTAFANAVDRFAEGLEILQREPDNTLYRDGVIQRFELTYELAHKTLKRYLKMTAANPGEIDEMVFQDLIRTGNERGLLQGDWPDWKTHRQSRTDTNHTYNEIKALRVLKHMPAFLAEARFLLIQLKIRTGQA